MQFLSTTQAKQSSFISTQSILLDEGYYLTKPSKQSKFKPYNVLLKSFIQSPLNYTGAKFRLLPQILPLFPKDISVMVDLFCGGASVGVNVSARHIILNDKQSELMEILALFKRENAESLLVQIADIITDFRLSDSANFGYAHYKCDKRQRVIKLQ